MKNKILWLLAIMLLISTTYADQETTQDSVISNLSYNWYLNEDTIIDIYWKDFDKCDNLWTLTKDIKISSKDNFRITFNYSELDKNSWTLRLTCDWKVNSLVYNFPYIKSVSWIKDWKITSNISILWENFWENPSVSGDNIVFEKSFSNSEKIVWMFTWLWSNEFYIQSGDFKSNLFKLDLKIPKITHIVGVDNFKAETKVIIFWENLAVNNDYKVLIWDTYIDKKSVNWKNIEIILPKIYWSVKLLVESNGIKSNELSINIDNKRPIILKIEEKQEINDIFNETMFYISWENFWSAETTNLYLNWNKVEINKFISSSLIKIKKPDLLPWDNIFELTINNKSSKVFNYYIWTSKLPELWWYYLLSSDFSNKEVVVYTSNFNQVTDKIYFNSSEISKDDLKCTNNSCSFKIPSSTLEWTFEVWRWAYKSPKKLYYDVKFESTPYISRIVFSKELWINTPFSIYGWKFAWSTIVSSNFLQADTNWKYDIRIQDDKITWYMTRDFNSSSPLTLSFTNWSLKTDINFTVSDLWNDLEILWKPIVKEFVSTNEDGMFKSWVKVNIISNNVSRGDIVVIWNKEIPVVYNWEKEPSYFVLPAFDDFREYDIYLKNKFNQKSENFKVIISDSTETNEIYFQSSSIDSKIFNLDTKKWLDKPLYVFNVTNKIKNVYLKNLTFKIKDYKAEYWFWTFGLTINWSKHPNDAMINSNWEIEFNNVEILKSNTPIEIKLFKVSTFIEKVNFNITLDTSKVIAVDEKSFIFKNINFWDFISNNIKLSYLEDDSCIDTESSRINCNSYNNSSYQDNSNIETPKIEDKPKVEEKPQVEKPVLNQNKDYFTLDIKTYSFKSKNYVNFNKQFKLYALRLQKQERLIDNSKAIEWAINGILESLYWYENSWKDKLKKKIYIQKLKFKVKEFKKAIK